jgi:hypothetical protein
MVEWQSNGKEFFTTKDLARLCRNQRKILGFITEARSSQRSECILIKKLFTPRSRRLCGEFFEILRRRSDLFPDSNTKSTKFGVLVILIFVSFVNFVERRIFSLRKSDRKLSGRDCHPPSWL